MPRAASVAIVLVLAARAEIAAAHYVNGYAVANHRSCGAGNLSGTIPELEKFFASAEFPDDAQKNFLWTDERVRQGEWGRGGDHFVSTESASGLDGVDSGLISYIATHGSTVDGVYTALAGGGFNNCAIKTSDVGVGDMKARYLVLSTCQGLKIGTGDDPSAPGADPRLTWAAANAGMNCIFGYSNNMVDSDKYGELLLANLAASDETLVEAFFAASRAVSYHNVPAVLCFGTDEANARQRLETSRRFVADKFGAGGSAYVVDRALKLDGAYELPRKKPFPRHLRVVPAAVKAPRLAEKLLGGEVKSLAEGELGVWRLAKGARGTVTYAKNTGVLTWRNDKLALGRTSSLKDQTAIRIAKDFVRTRGLAGDPDAAFQATHVIHRFATIGGKPTRVATTVVLHQRLEGLTSLDVRASVEVTVEADGQVASLTARLVEATKPNIVEWIDGAALDLSRQRRSALDAMKKEMPNANLTVLDTRLGYARETTSEGEARFTAAAEVTIEAEEGGFARRYVRQLAL